jgi:hypothetical protein
MPLDAMREYITKRLDDIRSPADKAYLREVLSEVFLPLYEDSERKFAELERRVRDELPLTYDTYTVYSTVFPRARADGSHAYLCPVCQEDVNEPVHTGASLIEALSNGEHITLETVFYEADYLKCRQIERNKRVFDGAFVLKSERYPFKVRLKPTTRYSEQVEALHDAFRRNGVPWTTVNAAYFGKFFDVCLTELPKAPPAGAQISTELTELDFGSESDSIRRGLIPVWNVDKYRVKGEDFPMPALDAVNYEYRFDIRGEDAENGLLVDYGNALILSGRRENGAFVLVSPQEIGLTWNMYRIRRRRDSPVDAYTYPILSNGRTDSFSARLMAKYGTHITTRAEMRKLLTSFESSEYVELADFHFAGEKLPGDTYDMNPFIRDEIRNPDFQKTLALSFKAKNRESILNRDVISFLVSEFQAAYPEYRCVGTLLP